MLLLLAASGGETTAATAPAALDRAEVWTDLACASGSRVAVLPLLSCITTESFEGRLASDKLTATVPRNATDAVAALLPRRVVRLTFTDGAFAEYRIQDLIDSGQGTEVQVRANGVLYDLATGLEMLRVVDNGRYTGTFELSGTPSSMLTDILAYAPAYFSVGTVPDPPNPLALPVANQLPLAATLALVEVLAVAQGESYELSARRVDTTGYALDITVLNDAAPAADVRTGKNLTSLRRTVSARDFATRIYPVMEGGDGAAYFVITDVTASDVAIAHIDGSAANPIIEDDALNGWYLAGPTDIQAITDTVRSGQRLTLADTSGFAVGDWVFLAATIDYAPLRQVDYPSAQTTYGVQALQLQVKTPGFTNFVKNPDMTLWPTDGQPPTDWLDPGVGNDDAPIRDTTTFLRGSKASRHYYDGSGYAASIECQNGAAFVAPGDTITYTVWYRPMTVGNGTAEFTATLPDATTHDFTLNSLAIAPERWYPVQYNYTVPAAEAGYQSAGSLRIAFLGYPQGLAGPGNIDLYWDSAQIAVNYTGTTFVRGSGGAQGWQRAVNYLLANTPPPRTYEVSLLDLTRFDSGTWPYDHLLLGGSVTLTDTDLDVTAQARVAQIQRNHLNPLATTVTIATRPSTLTSLLVAGT